VDRENKLAYLSAVETAVSDSLRRIAHQEQLLAELNRDGQDTKVPRAMLASLRRVQAEQLAIRDLLLKSLHNRSAIAKSGRLDSMEQDRLNDRANGLPAIAANFRYFQFSAADVFRRMQGDVLALLGFGPVESPYRVIASGRYWCLRDYGSAQGSRSVLIVAAPIKRPYIWDLTPTVSAVRYCLGAGLRVYLLEWLPASHETCCVGLAECGEAISASLAKIERGAEGGKPVLMGHSLGGTLAAIYAATAPATIDGLVLLSSPLCFRANESAFRDRLVSLVPAPVSDSDPYPGSILSQASAAASPHTFIWSRLMDAILSAGDGRAADIHARIERWALDEVALPGKLVREIVDALYRENQFCRGVLKVGEKTIGPSNLSVQILAVVNTADAVAPLVSLCPIRDVVDPDRLHILEYPGETGVCLQHLGILVGREAFARIWPEIVSWINAQGSAAGAPQQPRATDATSRSSTNRSN
jgi:polyhydroxyalkanoate synthase